MPFLLWVPSDVHADLCLPGFGPQIQVDPESAPRIRNMQEKKTVIISFVSRYPGTAVHSAVAHIRSGTNANAPLYAVLTDDCLGCLDDSLEAEAALHQGRGDHLGECRS